MTRKLFEDYLSGEIDYSAFKKEVNYLSSPGYMPQGSLEIELQIDISDFEWDNISTEEEFKANIQETYNKNKRYLN